MATSSADPGTSTVSSLRPVDSTRGSREAARAGSDE